VVGRTRSNIDTGLATLRIQRGSLPAEKPWSIAMSAPVMAAAAGEHRKKTSSATSCGWMNRALALRVLREQAFRYAWIAAAVVVGLEAEHGRVDVSRETTLARTPCGASSSAQRLRES
jgi:hypothetical protein